VPQLAQSRHSRIRDCEKNDFDDIHAIVNEAAQAYRGVIPNDCWHEPYMGRDDLRREIESGVHFFGYEHDAKPNGAKPNRAKLQGVMGMQNAGGVTLIRHAYVRPVAQCTGIGAALLSEVVKCAHSPLLVGTWATAHRAISFYRKNGFELATPEQTVSLLRKYWRIPRRQIETSVVLQRKQAHTIDTSEINAIESESGDV